MFLRPTSASRRLAALVIGAVWALAGGFWCYHIYFNVQVLDRLPPRRHLWGAVILIVGVRLMISAVQRPKPADFESETPDLHENLYRDTDRYHYDD